jgi:hypothetical protein
VVKAKAFPTKRIETIRKLETKARNNFLIKYNKTVLKLIVKV